MDEIRPVKFATPGGTKSPTQRTLAYLRERGYVCGMVERQPIPGRNLTVDLFHIIDAIAIAPGRILGIQSTGQDYAGHLEKLTVKYAIESTRWLRSGAGLYLIAWRKRTKSGQQYWDPRIKKIELLDLTPALQEQDRMDVLAANEEPEALEEEK